MDPYIYVVPAKNVFPAEYVVPAKFVYPSKYVIPDKPNELSKTLHSRYTLDSNDPLLDIGGFRQTVTVRNRRSDR